jgi:protein gp37
VSDHSPIEWLYRPNTIPSTWNPLVGCAKCCQGCKFCYAMDVVWMKGQHPNPKIRDKFAGLVTKAAKPSGGYTLNWTGEVRIWEPALSMPLRARKPRTYFVDEFSDLFYEQVPDEWLYLFFAIIAAARKHVFIAPTKRPGRAREVLNYLASLTPGDRATLFVHALRDWKLLDRYVSASDLYVSWPLPNYWHLASVVDQVTAAERIPHVLKTRVAVRGISYEPALGPVDLLGWLGEVPWGVGEPTLDWVICGGESGGAEARPMRPDWVRKVRDDCAETGTAFFFKQWGEWHPCSASMVGSTPSFMCHDETIEKRNGKRFELIDSVVDGKKQSFVRLGKSLSGARLDGREHKAWPA